MGWPLSNRPCHGVYLRAADLQPAEGSLKDLQGKLVLVTGGAVGIGRAIEERSAGQGAHLILTDVNVKALDEAATAPRSVPATPATAV